jgi:hypothetical protein
LAAPNRGRFTSPYLFWASWFPSYDLDLLPSKKSPFAFDYGSARRILRDDFRGSLPGCEAESDPGESLPSYPTVHTETVT